MVNQDSIQHYKYYYDITNKVSMYPNKIVYGILVFIMVSFFKEFIYDLLLKQGDPSFNDIKFNFLGCLDAILNNESMY
jgi:hypothetical protein